MESMTRLNGIEAVTQAEEEGLVLRASGSRLAMLMMKFVPEDQREAMVKELERVLAEKEAQGDVDDDEREVIDGTAQEVVEDDNGS
jgi:tripartite-type tricarboxylate transporter receptor subunit TctC